MKNRKAADIVKFCIFLGIGLFFIYWFLLKLEPEEKASIWASLKQARYGWLAGVMGFTLLSHAVRTLRWQLLYRPLGYRPRFNNTFGSVMVAYMGNLVFPRLGEVARCATMRTSEGIPVDRSLGTVVTERVVDVLAFFVIVLIGLLVMLGAARSWLMGQLSQGLAGLPPLWLVALLLVAAIVAAVLLYRLCRRLLGQWPPFQKIDRFVTGCSDGLRSILKLRRRDGLLFLLYSVIIYLLYICGGIFVFYAFDETVGLGFGAAFVIYLFGSVGMGFSQGGIGVYPVLIQSGLALYGISQATGLATGWLLWGSQQAITLLVGLIYWLYFSFSKQKSENDNPTSVESSNL